MNSLKMKGIENLNKTMEKLRRQGIDVQICKRPKMIHILTEEKMTL